MSVLLAPDVCAVYPPEGTSDPHGWVYGPAAGTDVVPPPAWTGRGNLQLTPGLTAVTASESGGAGPFAPNSTSEGTVYLPEDCPARDGWLLAARGQLFFLGFQHSVPDPSLGLAGCRTASVTEVQGVIAPALQAHTEQQAGHG